MKTHTKTQKASASQNCAYDPETGSEYKRAHGFNQKASAPETRTKGLGGICSTCGNANDIVNECGCDPNNLPTRLPEWTEQKVSSYFTCVVGWREACKLAIAINTDIDQYKASAKAGQASAEILAEALKSIRDLALDSRKSAGHKLTLIAVQAEEYVSRYEKARAQ